MKELAKRLRDETATIRESARYPLPYDIDRNLSKELDALASSLDQLARIAEELANQSGLKNGAVAKQLAKLSRRLLGGREDFNESALAPIELLARIYPLLEDQSRFVQLYLHQRDLAQRMASLKGHDAVLQPAIKARMRDLEGEQRQIQSELTRLLDDIEDHARLLPDDSRLAQLRETAQAFATAVRGSGASQAMSDAAAALSVFAGTQSVEKAQHAADILEKFLAQCTGGGEMAGACEGCLKFQPRLAAKLGNSIEQMLADAGLPLPGQIGQIGSGRGIGAGSGYSARQSNLNNVGLYGNLPALLSSSRQGSGRSAAGVGAGRSDGATAARHAPETSNALGPCVPLARVKRPYRLLIEGGSLITSSGSPRRSVTAEFEEGTDMVRLLSRRSSWFRPCAWHLRCRALHQHLARLGR